METQQLFVRGIDQIATVMLPGTERAASPFLSPDGQSVAFWADNTLKRTRLRRHRARPRSFARWSRFSAARGRTDGTIVFGSTQSRPAAGRCGRWLAPAARRTVDPASRRSTTTRRRCCPAAARCSSRFMRVSAVPHRRADPRHRRASDCHRRRVRCPLRLDRPYRLCGGHGAFRSAVRSRPPRACLGPRAAAGRRCRPIEREGHARYALSDTGTLVFLPRAPPARRTLAWVDRAGKTTPLPLEPRAYWTPRLSPDGRQFAVVVRGRGASPDLDPSLRQRHVQPPDVRGQQLGAGVVARWIAADLCVRAERPVAPHARAGSMASAAAEVLLTSATDELEPGALSADGRSLIYVKRSPTGDAELRVLDLPSGGKSRRSTVCPIASACRSCSPDGRWLGFTGWTPDPSIHLRSAVADAGPGPPAGRRRRLHGLEPHRRPIYSSAAVAVRRTARRDGIFELPFDPIRGVATGPERQLFRKAFTDWLGVPGLRRRR